MGRILLAAALAGGLAGCGAMGAIGRAENALNEARAAGAEVKAPYEYYAAQVYLDLASHEKGEMDLRQSRAWARESAEFSAKALEKAKGGAR